jgi:hypothetical protein
MLYCPGPGEVLHAVRVMQRPWNRLSGVLFSCTTTMICWKFAICAAAGVVKNAATAKGIKRSAYLLF